MARRVRKSRAGLERWNQFVQILRDMNFAFNNVRIYPPTHTEVNQVISRLHESLIPLTEELGDVGFGFMDDMLYIEGAMSIEETKKNEMLVERFSKCRVKYMTIMKGIRREDLLNFFIALTDEAKKDAVGPPAEAVAAKEVEHIHVVEAEVDDVASKSKLARKRTLLDWYVKAVSVLEPILASIKKGDEADLKTLYRLADDMMATMRTKGHEPFLLLPYLAKGLDRHTAHCVNVAITACALGILHGLNSGQLQTLAVAAFLHDLGRFVLPPAWLDKPTPLSAAEKAVAEQHATWGFLLLMRDKSIPAQIGVLSAKHHGSPDEKAEDAYTPDIFQKIIRMADAYDLAQFGDAYYWKKRRRDRILRRILKRRGIEYDRTLANLLTQLVGLYPVGTMVRLNNGERGIVVRSEPGNIERPKVYLFGVPPERAEEYSSVQTGQTPGTDGEAEPARPAPEAEDEIPPVVADLMDLTPDGLHFKFSIAGASQAAEGERVGALLDAKKEFLLSYTL
jgi:HD-GYP domain-containing protein (c-di-GMP phosphodiesterase class II)